MRALDNCHSIRIYCHSNCQALHERGFVGRHRVFRSQNGASIDHEKDCQHANNFKRVHGE